MDWFPQQRMKTKRQEIKDVILKIQNEQQESGDPTDGCQSPSKDSSDLIPPISSWALPTLLRFIVTYSTNTRSQSGPCDYTLLDNSNETFDMNDMNIKRLKVFYLY